MYEPQQQPKHDCMHAARNPEGSCNTNGGGDAVEAVLAVVLRILAGIEHVKPRHPEKDGSREHENTRIKTSANRNPRGSRRDSQRQPKKEMRPAREALGVGIEQ